MRGRVVILLILVVVIVGGAAAFFLLGQGDDDTPPPTEAPTIDPGLPLEAIQGTQTAISEIATRQAEDRTTPIPEVVLGSVVIAVQDLPRGFRLTDDFLFGSAPAVAVVGWPLDSVPVNGFGAIESLQGQNYLIRSDIPRESPILSTNLVQDADALAVVGSDAALLLEPGLVAISLPLDIFGIGQVAYGLQYGDYVDVILSFLFIEVDEIFQSRQPNIISVITRGEDGSISFTGTLQGRPEPSTLSSLGVLVTPTETQRPRLITQRTVQRAFVLRVGYFPPDGRIIGVMTPTPFNTATPDPEAPPPDAQQEAVALPTATEFAPVIVTLGVEPQDAVVLTWALDSRTPMTLALRSAREAGEVNTNAVTLQYMIENYNIPPPPLLPFSLEPALRSLRTSQLAIFDVFEIPVTNLAANQAPPPGQ